MEFYSQGKWTSTPKKTYSLVHCWAQPKQQCVRLVRMFSKVFFSWIPEFNSSASCLSLVFLDWGITNVKAWALDKFKCEAIANSFEREEVDGKILLSARVQSQEVMESLGLKTLGKEATFLDEIHKLTGTHLQYRLKVFTLLPRFCRGRFAD